MPDELLSSPENHPAVKAIDAAIEAVTQLRESGAKLVPIDAEIWNAFCSPVKPNAPQATAPTKAPVTGQMPVVDAPSQVQRVGETSEVVKASLAFLQNEIKRCNSCPLACETHLAAIGCNYAPKVMVINGAYMMGDRPEAIGSRLEGSAGEMLWKMLHAIHISPHETYLTHAIRCPVNGRPPRDAILRCSEWLRQEIKVIQPKVIILLGPFAGATLFPNASAAMTAVGRWSLFENIPCVTLHHPMRIQMLADLAVAMKTENWKALQAVQARLEKE